MEDEHERQDKSQKDVLLNAALEYIEDGWSVIPLNRTTSDPSINGGNSKIASLLKKKWSAGSINTKRSRSA